MKPVSYGPSLIAGAPSAPSGDESDGKNRLAGFSGKILYGRRPGLIPRGTGDLDRLPPAVFEALNRHMKSLGTIRHSRAPSQWV
jgi:hypothetical protein